MLSLPDVTRTLEARIFLGIAHLGTLVSKMVHVRRCEAFYLELGL
jgi:hypothetical protein